MIAYDFVVPTFTEVPGRGAGFYGNPNSAGQVTALAMIAGAEALPKRLRLPFIAACGIGIFLTFSRSAWLLWGLSAAMFGWYSGRRQLSHRILIRGITTLFAVGILVGLFAGEVGKWLSGTSIAQFLDPNTLGRLGIGATSLSGYAAESRMGAALYAVHIFPLAPWFGHGIGYVYEWAFSTGPHNMYLRFLAEGGAVGLLLYLALMWIVWRGSVGLGRVVAAQIIVGGLFSHNMLEQPAIVLAIVFALSHGGLSRMRSVASAGGRLPQTDSADVARQPLRSPAYPPPAGRRSAVGPKIR
jgi:O-antigen ligase